MDQISVQQIARVAVPVPVDKPFSYSIPSDFKELIQRGSQVIVPFGQRYIGGIVLNVTSKEEEPDYELKPIYDVVQSGPFIGNDLMQLLEWISSYYVCYLGEAYRLINPTVNLHKSKFELRKNGTEVPDHLSPALKDVLENLSPDKWISLKSVEAMLKKKDLLYRVHKLKKLDLIESRYIPPKPKKIYKSIDVFEVEKEKSWTTETKNKYLSNNSKKYIRSRELIAFLQNSGISTRQELLKARFSPGTIDRLVKEGVLRRTTKKIYRHQSNIYAEEIKPITLNKDQLEFISKVTPYLGDTPEQKTFLLHGITGSGKTEIYIELIRNVLKQGRQAIVLIPEIVLTPQTMARFRHHFKDQVAVIHSRQSPGEKAEILQKIREDKLSIVVGPRSAIFAPFKNLGLIIVDEEQEGSYKQSDSVPRYNARDVALYRAYLNNIPVILGSATPSFESLYNARTQKYEYFYLSSRISSRQLPRTQLVNFREEWRRTGSPLLFSENLLLKLEARLVSREQAMLLQNRRGFSPYIMCKECGYVEKCPNCDITLTYHFKGKNLQCHYCGYIEQAPDVCPQCKGFDILYKGVGTQKIEGEAKEKFPHGGVLRMDQDTTRRKNDLARLLEKFRNGEADFLIGTKMIAKGLDFERVTLVGIVNADQGLHFPDFRATEKVFQLLVQAAGRAGRGAQSGEVVIQTFDPNHYIFKYLMTHNYLGFYEREVETRKTLNYPPFSRLSLIRISGEDEEKVMHYAQQVAKFLWQANEDKRFGVLGPAPAPLVRINNRYRYHILIKQDRQIDPSMSYVRHLLKEGIYKNPKLKKWPVDLQIDMDPLEIL